MTLPTRNHHPFQVFVRELAMIHVRTGSLACLVVNGLGGLAGLKVAVACTGSSAPVGWAPSASDLLEIRQCKSPDFYQSCLKKPQ